MLEIRDPRDGFAVAEGLGTDARHAEEQAPVLRQALARNGVLCLRMDAPLDDEGLQAVAGLFGPIKELLARAKDGSEFCYGEAKQIIDSGFVMTDEIREKLKGMTFGGLDDQRPGLFETYHCDDTYVAEPAGATVLHARALPPSGGGPTFFIDMRGALDRLDPETRRGVAGLRVVYAYNNHDAFPPRRAASGPADVLEDVTHPLVRTHAVAGTQALFLDLDRATHIEGMPVAEGRKLLQQLQDHAEGSAPACQHDWREHDVLIWDNASVQHKAGGNFKVGEARRFWRYMIEGGRPV